MKRCLKRTIGQSRLSYDELSTLVTEVEAILNSRPLSYVSTSDIEEPLTPSHLIVGRRLLTLPNIAAGNFTDDPDFQPKPDSSLDLNRRLIHLNKVIDHFWNRWRKEYLLELRESHRYAAKRGSSGKTIQLGDIVILFDPDHPRTFWILARVENLIEGEDGQVRGAVIRTVTKGGKIFTL